MIYHFHGKSIEYGGEQCGFYKFNGLIWDYIPMDMGMFLGGLNDVSISEALSKTKKIHDALLEQVRWDSVPEIPMRSSFLAPQKPVPIDNVRMTLERARMVLASVVKALE
jgi:hypothetical protein